MVTFSIPTHIFQTHPRFSELKKANEIDTNWHIYGELWRKPKNIKALLRRSTCRWTIVSQAGIHLIDILSWCTEGFYLSDFGSFLGTLDDIKFTIVDFLRIAQVYAGDANQTGLVEYRVVEKPQIQTLPAMEARPDSGILRANLSSIGGEIIESEVTLGENFEQDTVQGYKHGLMPIKSMHKWCISYKMAGSFGPAQPGSVSPMLRKPKVTFLCLKETSRKLWWRGWPDVDGMTLISSSIGQLHWSPAV